MYIGTQPYHGFRARHTYTATAGQDTFSGAGAENVSLSYSDEMYIDVYQNGVKLSPADYTATNGTQVVLGTAASVNDIVEVLKYDTFAVADTVSAKDGGGFGGNISTSGNLAVTGTSAFTGAITANAGVVVDNITIDGTEIDLSSGNLTLDVAGTINLDSDTGSVNLVDAGTTYGELVNDSTDLVIKTSQADRDMIFKGVDGSSLIEAMRIDYASNGRITINGTDSTEQSSHCTLLFASASYSAYAARMTDNGSGAGFFVARTSDNSTIGQIARNGTSAAVQFLTSSDYRLKENVNYSFDATSKIKQLKPCEFTWKNDDSDVVFDGFLAHEVQEVVPYAINGKKDAVDEDGNIEAQSIDKSDLVPLLVKSLQEAMTRIETLEAEVKTLKGE